VAGQPEIKDRGVPTFLRVLVDGRSRRAVGLPRQRAKIRFGDRRKRRRFAQKQVREERALPEMLGSAARAATQRRRATARAFGSSARVDARSFAQNFAGIDFRVALRAVHAHDFINSCFDPSRTETCARKNLIGARIAGIRAVFFAPLSPPARPPGSRARIESLAECARQGASAGGGD
jgi:hypothetical protein